MDPDSDPTTVAESDFDSDPMNAEDEAEEVAVFFDPETEEQAEDGDDLPEEEDEGGDDLRGHPSPHDEGDDEDERPRQRARTSHDSLAAGAEDMELGEDENAEEEEDDEAEGEQQRYWRYQGTLREWVARDDIREFVKRKFRRFLNSFRNDRDKEEIEYLTRIKTMMEGNGCSLPVHYMHIAHTIPVLSVWLADVPKQILELLDEVTRAEVFRRYPNYEAVHDAIHVRIAGLPLVEQIRNIRQVHLNTLLKVGGVVTRRTGVFPQLQQVKYDCAKCGSVLGPFFQNSTSEIKVGSCPECQSRGPFTVNVEKTVYRNYQKLTLQESPGTVPAGRLPRYKEVILLHDLIDVARPGEEIEVTGVYINNFDAALNMKNGFPVFSTIVEANYVEKKLDLFAAYRLTDEDKEEILQLSRDPQIAERIFRSMAPSIFGHHDIKTALALAMFGGQEKNVAGKHRLRGDINVLLLGDPGTAKSQFLKYLEKTANRAVYTTGKGASAVGLTAAVHKDPITREWTLEGGALVLADRGMCLIDEFDKMNDQDRVSIHEAMEQQSISISKAGIVTSLQARCSVVAAANPVRGRYDQSKTFAENVELTEPILSRFDILLVIKDDVDELTDRMLAEFVVESHHKSHPSNVRTEEEADGDLRANADDQGILSQEMLRKYMIYAKQNVFPKLQDTDMNKIAQVYADLRRESTRGQGVPMAVRHIESMIRMAEAHARMHLRPYVNADDVDMAISMLLNSFISTQKLGVQKAIQKTFRKYMTYKVDYNQMLLGILRELVKSVARYEEYVHRRTLQSIEVKVEDLKAKAREYEIYDLQPFFSSSHFRNNFALDADQGIIRHDVY